MFDPVIINDLGRVSVSMLGASQEIDIVRVNNDLARIQAKHGADVVAMYDAESEYIASLGYPPPSHLATIAFSDAITAMAKKLMDELKNAVSGETKRVSPASTASTPLP